MLHTQELQKIWIMQEWKYVIGIAFFPWKGEKKELRVWVAKTKSSKKFWSKACLTLSNNFYVLFKLVQWFW